MGSSSGWTTGRGCSFASAAPSRWSGFTQKPRRPSSATRSLRRVRRWSADREQTVVSSQTISVLEDAAAIKRRDPSGMLERVAEFGEQLRSGWELSRGLQLGDVHRTATAVAVLGMGGSAVAADLLRAIFADRLTVPLVSVRDYYLPAWVGRTTLVVAVSHSGATEETVTALSAALERRYPVLVITTGGPIGDVAARVGLPRLIYSTDASPRASLGYTMSLLAG